MAAGRTLELIETKEIEQLLATVLDDMHEKEKRTLELIETKEIEQLLATV